MEVIKIEDPYPINLWAKLKMFCPNDLLIKHINSCVVKAIVRENNICGLIVWLIRCGFTWSGCCAICIEKNKYFNIRKKS